MKTFFIYAGLILAILWLWSGILAYGIRYAYLQRKWPSLAQRHLYRDMRIAAKGIWRGFLYLGIMVHDMRAMNAWNEETNKPIYGLKFLPRHECRYTKEEGNGDAT